MAVASKNSHCRVLQNSLYESTGTEACADAQLSLQATFQASKESAKKRRPASIRPADDATNMTLKCNDEASEVSNMSCHSCSTEMKLLAQSVRT